MVHIRARQARPESAAAVRSHGGTGRKTLALVALLLPLVLTFALLDVASSFAITRDDVLARAQTRVDAPVPYSQTEYYGGYRTDCSGYVSMAWGTGTSWTTRSFYRVSYPIPTNQLQPGDAMLKNGHIRLFYGWFDDARTRYVAYETANGLYAGTRIHSIADDLRFGYVPTRYDRISSSPKPRNILKNGTFNVWTSYGKADRPVWWDAKRPPASLQATETLVLRRKDTYRSARNSLKLRNPAGSTTATYTELSQSAPVVAGASYHLRAWAKTGFAPQGVELRLIYLNAANKSVAETSTTGDRAYLNATSFKSMSLLSTAPADAVRALVAVRLAGGSTTNASGTVPVNTSVTLDDISLVRPYVTVGIKTSATTSYSGRTILLSGSVTPTSAIGVPVTVYVQRPGSGWTNLSASRVYASGSAAAWKGKFSFTRSMPRGTYRFMTRVSTFPGYLGSTSSAVSVRLK